MKIWYCHSNRDGGIFYFLTFQSALKFIFLDELF